MDTRDVDWPVQQFALIADSIRQWAPRLLAVSPELQCELEEAVSFLDVADSAFGSMAVPGKRSKYDALTMLHTVITAFKLKSRKNLKVVYKNAVAHVVPPYVP